MAEFAEIFIERRWNSGISCEEIRLKELSAVLDAGAGIRIISGKVRLRVYQ